MEAESSTNQTHEGLSSNAGSSGPSSASTCVNLFAATGDLATSTDAASRVNKFTCEHHFLAASAVCGTWYFANKSFSASASRSCSVRRSRDFAWIIRIDCFTAGSK